MEFRCFVNCCKQAITLIENWPIRVNERYGAASVLLLRIVTVPAGKSTPYHLSALISHARMVVLRARTIAP